jgi:hypothetical protein
MEDSETYCCWIRILASTQSATAASVDGGARLAALPSEVRLDVLAGPRPPRVPVLAAKNSASAPAVEAIFYADELCSGEPQADTVFDYGPAFFEADDARLWLASPEGQVWVAEALNYFMICLERHALP